MEIGTIVTKENYTKTAIECNKLGDRHIELIDGQYVIVANPAPAEPTIEEACQVHGVDADEFVDGINQFLKENADK